MVQIIANGIFESSIILLVALGFSLIYGTTRFFHLAHGAVFMIGGYATFLFFSSNHNFLFSIILAIFVSAAAGIFMEVFVYRYLRKRKVPSLIYLITSLGLLLLFQNIVALLFGNETRAITFTENTSRSYEAFGAVVTREQIIIVLVSVILSVLLTVFLKTGTGLSLKALSDNDFLARAMGINVDRMMVVTFAIGSALAGVAGGLVGIETTIHPSMGFAGTLFAMLACIVGGLGSITGTIIGSFLIGMVQSFGVAFLAPEWKDTIALSVLFIVLLFRPHGIIGRT